MDMPLGDLYETLYMVLEALDRIFEFWLSASFAIVVAAFLGADKLTRGNALRRHLLLWLYLTCTVFAVGTLGTLYFVWSTYSSQRASKTEA